MYFVDLRISGFIHREMAIFWLSFLIKLGAFLGLKCPFLGFTIQRGGGLCIVRKIGVLSTFVSLFLSKIGYFP